MINSLQKLSDAKVLTDAQIAVQVKLWKDNGEKIVFTNGCFDLIHVGHISYMLEAASLGTKLIVGLNSDQSVKKLKGESRPVNTQENRAILLASLFFVDAVVVFEEETPLNLITTIMPDVLTKGGDYEVRNVVGSKEVLANGGEVKLIDFIKGYSSTLFIEKLSK